ncbi:hypothetical protein T484DRAFT_1756175 [Baffinella frigidus]|nr:hypothetical protein T484DRAFT_1756175 [Cryptophyta sp. CCMP2293]
MSSPYASVPPMSSPYMYTPTGNNASVPPTPRSYMYTQTGSNASVPPTSRPSGSTSLGGHMLEDSDRSVPPLRMPRGFTPKEFFTTPCYMPVKYLETQRAAGY